MYVPTPGKIRRYLCKSIVRFPAPDHVGFVRHETGPGSPRFTETCLKLPSIRPKGRWGVRGETGPLPSLVRPSEFLWIISRAHDDSMDRPPRQGLSLTLDRLHEMWRGTSSMDPNFDNYRESSMHHRWQLRLSI